MGTSGQAGSGHGSPNGVPGQPAQRLPDDDGVPVGAASVPDRGVERGRRHRGVALEPGAVVVGREVHGHRPVAEALQLGDQAVPVPGAPTGAGDEEDGAHVLPTGAGARTHRPGQNRVRSASAKASVAASSPAELPVICRVPASGASMPVAALSWSPVRP